ncbi:hypothetical protein [Clostridium sp.]
MNICFMTKSLGYKALIVMRVGESSLKPYGDYNKPKQIQEL